MSLKDFSRVCPVEVGSIFIVIIINPCLSYVSPRMYVITVLKERQNDGNQVFSNFCAPQSRETAQKTFFLLFRFQTFLETI